MTRGVVIVSLIVLIGCRQRPERSPPTTAPALATAAAGPILAGRIVDEQGQPVPGVRVTTWGGFATRFKGSETVTDADGSYRFEPVQVCSVLEAAQGRPAAFFVGLQIRHPTLASTDGHSWWDVQVPIVAGQVTRQDFTMTPGGGIEGWLTEADTGRPLAKKGVRLSSPGPKHSTYYRYTETDDEGHFVETGLYPGHYVIDLNQVKPWYPVVGEVEVQRESVTPIHMKYGAPSGGHKP